MKVKLISREYSFRFRFRMDIDWTDDLSHSCPHRYLIPNFTFAFAFAILKVINSEIILFRFALISVSMMFALSSRRSWGITFGSLLSTHFVSGVRAEESTSLWDLIACLSCNEHTSRPYRPLSFPSFEP